MLKRGLLIQFFSASYTAQVLLLEATNTVLQDVPVACHMDGTSAQQNALCVVQFFDELDYTDAVVFAVYPNGSQGVPRPTPGRCVFVTGYQHFASQSIAAGVTSSFTLSGGSSGIPLGVLGVMYKASFSSPTVGAFIHLAPHAASDITAYATIGQVQLAGSVIHSVGQIPLDSSGRIDIKANTGTCTVTLYTYGYIY